MDGEEGRGQPRRHRYRSPSYNDDSRGRESSKRSRNDQRDNDRRQYRHDLRRCSTSSSLSIDSRKRRSSRDRDDGDARRRSLSPAARPRRRRSSSLDRPARSPKNRDRRRQDRAERRSRPAVSPDGSLRASKPRHRDESVERSRRHRQSSFSPSRHTYRRHSHSRSPKRRKTSPSGSLSLSRRTGGPLPTQADSFGRSSRGIKTDALDHPVEKQKPNYNATGALARETNTVAGTKIVLKYNEPPDSRKPPSSQAWRLYIFKPSQSSDPILPPVRLHSRTTWLLGRETAVADLPIEHPSCSKQHAVIQFRYTTKVNEYGDKDSKVRPYVIDLGSANGTILNGDDIQKERFVELRDGDVLKFGESEREYVLMLPDT